MTGEATPDYLLYSQAQAILCTTPWVKLIVLLRPPLERLFSHYVIPAGRQGWHRYQCTVHAGLQDKHLAQSLYAPQLEEWFRNLRHVGKDPKKHLKVDIKVSKSPAVRDLIAWLNPNALNKNEPQNTKRKTTPQVSGEQLVSSKQKIVTHYTSTKVDPAFQDWLNAILFQPFNQRLYRLLGPECDGIFDQDVIMEKTMS